MRPPEPYAGLIALIIGKLCKSENQVDSTWAVGELQKLDWFQQTIEDLADYVVGKESEFGFVLDSGDIALLITRHFELWFLGQTAKLNASVDILSELVIELNNATSRCVTNQRMPMQSAETTALHDAYLEIVVPPPDSASCVITTADKERTRIYSFQRNKKPRRWRIVYALWRSGPKGMSADDLLNEVYDDAEVDDLPQNLWTTIEGLNGSFIKNNCDLEVYREKRHSRHYLRRRS